MDQFAFYAPRKTRFGVGSAGEAANEAALLGTRALLVTDPGLLAVGVVESILGDLQRGLNSLEVFDSVVPNPRDIDAEKGAESAVAMGADLVVAVGGGSAMDTAKAIATVMTNGGKPSDYFGADTIAKPIAPLICIPTTSGTGSEVTPFAVITDAKTRVKMNILDPKVVPLVSIVDPQLTASMPAALTASTGMDALTHAIEAYTCTLATPVTDAMALKAITLISRSLRRAVEDGSDIEARTQMALGSLIAGYAFANADVGGVHCMAEAIGGFYDTPHGVANSVFLPLVMEFNMTADLQRHADIAAAMGIDVHGLSTKEAAALGVQAVATLAADLGIPRFADLDGVSPDDFSTLAGLAAANVSAESNPRPAGEAEYLALFQQAHSA